VTTGSEHEGAGGQHIITTRSTDRGKTWTDTVDIEPSDDNGRCWSKKRYPIDVRAMEIDRENVYGGAIRFFWNVGKPFIHEGSVFVPLCKVGGFGPGFFVCNEGVLLKSDNILKEKDPERIRWEILSGVAEV